jgi:CDGSH-type Zn-finger protein/uncharacterized Fe-S cluster protein YjdI
MVETVQGRDVTVMFDGKRCVHSRGCVLSHPEVFVPNVQGEWIFPDAAPAAEVIRLGQNCPSGAIRVTRNDGSETSDAAPKVNTLRIRENGPLALEARVLLRGQALDSPRATLCRCGASQNKPFCDGSHAAAGFAASGEVVAKESVALTERGGPVEVSPLKDGPLKLTGSVEVVTGTGHTVNRATALFLCRCGQSQNKPYCDGSHKAAEFVAE